MREGDPKLRGFLQAVENGITLKGQHLQARLRTAQALETEPSLITLHLSNLNAKIKVLRFVWRRNKYAQEEDVRAALADCGHICDVRLAGALGFVDVETKTAAKKAIKLSPLTIRGKEVASRDESELKVFAR